MKINRIFKCILPNLLISVRSKFIQRYICVVFVKMWFYKLVDEKQHSLLAKVYFYIKIAMSKKSCGHWSLHVRRENWSFSRGYTAQFCHNEQCKSFEMKTEDKLYLHCSLWQNCTVYTTSYWGALNVAAMDIILTKSSEQITFVQILLQFLVDDLTLVIGIKGTW